LIYDSSQIGIGKIVTISSQLFRDCVVFEELSLLLQAKPMDKGPPRGENADRSLGDQPIKLIS